MSRLIRAALFSVDKARQHQIRAYRSPFSEYCGKAPPEGFRQYHLSRSNSGKLPRDLTDQIK